MVRNMSMSMQHRLSSIFVPLTLLTCTCCIQTRRPALQVQDERNIEQISRAYKLAVNDRQKRDIVIRAMDAGLIRRDASFDVVRQVCNGDIDAGRNEDGALHNVVWFIHVRYVVPDGQPWCDGWTLYVRHVGTRITDLRLSDTRQLRRGPYPGYELCKRYSLDELASMYAAAQNDRARRDVVLAAMDCDIVRLHGPLESLKRICGGDFDEGRPDERGVFDGLVDFGRAGRDTTEPARDAAQPVADTWFLTIEHSHDQITGYSLSNVRAQ
jgi:hypothetical protein